MSQGPVGVSLADSLRALAHAEFMLLQPDVARRRPTAPEAAAPEAIPEAPVPESPAPEVEVVLEVAEHPVTEPLPPVVAPAPNGPAAGRRLLESIRFLDQ